MITLILVVFFLIVFIILTIAGGNYALKSLIDSFIGDSKETFDNYSNKNNLIDSIDSCKQIDKFNLEKLNTQTGTNIPLSPNNYEDYVGIIYDNIKDDKNDELKQGNYCLYKNELLYDGIWKSDMKKPRPGFVDQDWILTNGNVMNDYYCSNKLVQLNKKIPNNFVDMSQTPKPSKEINKITYFNDCLDDPLDIQLSCFPPIFNKGITPSTKDFSKEYNN
jgi:hypothetical protein